MTPDGTPVVGATPLPTCYLDTGHGTLGWTMACGSARVLADMISGKQPEIDTKELSITRYDHRFGRSRRRTRKAIRAAFFNGGSASSSRFVAVQRDSALEKLSR